MHCRSIVRRLGRVPDPKHHNNTGELARIEVRVKLRAGRTEFTWSNTNAALAKVRHTARSPCCGFGSSGTGARRWKPARPARQPFVDDRAGGQRRPAEFGPVAGPPAPGTAVGARCFVRVCWTGVPLVVTGEPGGRDRPASAAERCPLTEVIGRYPTPRRTRKGALVIYGSPRDALNGKVIEGAGPAALL